VGSSVLLFGVHYLACSAILLEGLYILLALIYYFFSKLADRTNFVAKFWHMGSFSTKAFQNRLQYLHSD